MFAHTSYAQAPAPRISTCKSFLPKILLDSDVLKESDAQLLAKDPNYGQNANVPSEKKYWIVYSDREKNQTYSSPSTSAQPCKVLAFNEELRIADIRNGFALVYKEPQLGISYPNISSDAVSMGWVPMDKLLLWSQCLANNIGIYYKALLCLNLDQTQSRTNNLGLGFRNPENRTATSFQLKTDMDFYFIMKRMQDGTVLLSKQPSLSDGVSGVLHCWVSKDSYIPWNQRSCLEPTWNINDAEYFANNGIRAMIYEDKSGGKQVSYVDYKIIDNPSNRDRYRMPAHQLRFPILDGGTRDMYRCSVFSSSNGKGSVTDPSAIIGENKKTQSNSLDKLKHLNLSLVIDGTTSMGKYFPAVQRAIERACVYFADGNYTIKVSALIYRDYPDGPDGLVELCNPSSPWMRPDDPRIKDFLEKGGNSGYGIRSSASDRTNTEAVFYGINYALDHLKFDKEESNLMLVVGDCGNAEDDPNIGFGVDELAAKLSAAKVHFMGFQVRNIQEPGIDHWFLFNMQMSRMMRQNLQNRYDELVAGQVVQMKQDSYGFTLNNPNSELFVGAHKYSVQGGELDASHLENLMIETVKFCAKAIDAQLNVMVSADKIGTETSSFGSSSREIQTLKINEQFLIERLGKEFYEKQKLINSLMTFSAYTPKKDASGKPYYKPIVFLSDTEFNSLLYRLKPVYDAAKDRSKEREPYLNAIKALLRSMVPDITEEEMSNKSDQEIMNMIAGLNESTATLKGYTLKQITEKTVVDDRKYEEILDKFSRKYRALEGIRNNPNYKFSYEFNGTKYYWIPMEQMP